MPNTPLPTISQVHQALLDGSRDPVDVQIEIGFAVLALTEQQRIANVIARAHVEAVLGSTGLARKFLDSV